MTSNNELLPRFESIGEVVLAGKRSRRSLSRDTTRELWKAFMPELGQIATRTGSDLYSVAVYGGLDFFTQFDPHREFDSWAAVPIKRETTLPEGLETLTVPPGLYAVFHYKGRPSQIRGTYQDIFGNWLPRSGYVLENRPHMAVMGAGYKGEHPDSEEFLWIPVGKK
jgi:AraC family transcriptional regulator